MKTIVIKRDGCKVSFDQTRISDAIKRAAVACEITDDDYCVSVAQSVSQSLAGRSNVDIREIQDAVENQLMAGKHKDVARAYIEYRHDRDVAREQRGRLTQEIRGLIEQSDVSILHENANKDSKVIPTQRDLLAGIVANITQNYISCQEMWYSLMSVAKFIIMISITHRFSLCLTVC